MKIFAIGGGGNGRPGRPYEILKFDQEIIALSAKENPRLLCISFAQKTKESAQEYFDAINKNFSALGCACWHVKDEDLKDIKNIEEKINSSDIIYVFGGNTLKLMNIFRKYKIDKMLEEVGDRGVVLCGSSAGGICWHRYGNSDSRRYTSNSTQLIKVTGLGFIDALFCPHYDVESSRQESLKNMMKTTKGVALAFDNCAALKVINDNYWVVTTKDTAMARKCYWQKGEYVIEQLDQSGNVQDLVSKSPKSDV